MNRSGSHPTSIKILGQEGKKLSVAGGRASGQEQGTEAGVRIAEIAGNERRGMELRATGFCLALLWGCALAAAATQGKEGECLRGGRSQQ